MDKRWRNLGVLVVIIIVVVGGYYFLSNKTINPIKNPDLPANPASLEDGYKELVSLFEKNDVNIFNVRQMHTFFYSPMDKKIIWVEDKESLANLGKDLINFRDNLKKSYSVEDSNELYDVTNLYITAIGFSLKDSALLEFANNELYNPNLTCQDLSKVQDANKAFLNAYTDIYTLARMTDAFSINHGMYSEPIIIDLDAEYKALTDTTSDIQAVINTCKGEKL